MADWTKLESRHCRRCRTDVEFPIDLTDGEKAAIASERRAQPLMAPKFWQDAYGLSLYVAKGLAAHITSESGVCHRCRHAVIGSEVLCANCGGFNLNW